MKRQLIFVSLFGLQITLLLGQEPTWQEIERLRSEGRFEQALTLLQSQRARVSSPRDMLAAARLEQLILHDLQRYDEAQAAGRHRILQAEQTGDGKQLAEAHYDTGRSFGVQYKSEPAAGHFRKALDYARSAKDPKLELATLLDLATTEAELSNYSTALSLLDRAEPLWNQIQDPVLGARLWMYRGTVASYQDELSDALVYYERARQLAGQTSRKSLQAAVLNNLGQTHMRLHHYAEALALYQKSLETDRSARQANNLISIGICHFEINQIQEAAKVFEEARQTAISIGSPPLEAWALGELGLTVWKGERDFKRAIDYFDQSIAIFQKSNSPRNALVFMDNKAHVYREEGRFREALDLYGKIEAMVRATPGEKLGPNYYKGKGQSLAALGRLGEAEQMLARSISEAESTRDTKRIWQANQELARLYSKQNRRDEADRSYQNALNAIESMRQSLRVGGFKADFFEDKVKVYEEYVSFLLDRVDDIDGARRAFEVAERARSRSFLDSLAESRASVQETLPREVVQKEKSILAEISELQAQIRRGQANPERTRGLREKEKELSDLYVRVRSEHPRFRELRYPQPARLEEIQKVLRPDEALLEYMLGEKASYLWLIGPQEVRCVRLPARSAVEATIQKALGQLQRPNLAAPELESSADLLLGPLALNARLPKSLIIIPSGVLYYFPFEVLPLGTNGEPLARLCRVSYMPSATMLTNSRSLPTRATRPRLLALGDPVYRENQAGDAQRSAAMVGIQNLGNLPHTRTEITAIRSQFGRFHSTLLLGNEATEMNFKGQDLSRYSIIHLATHGWLDANSPSGSGLVLGMDSGSQDDGVLQVREIFQLPLKSSLVTLSACQSALGKLTTGEGMVGVTRAFFYAGAESIVASLWNVNDEATAKFMSAFYGFLARGDSKGEALRQAKLALRKDSKYHHPYFWAAYVLIGEGSDPVAFPSSWPAVGAAAVLVASLAAFVLYRRLPG